MLEHGFHKMQQNKFPRERSEDQNRVNWQIRVPQVRVVREEEQLGIMATDEARKLAMDNGLDLVEIAPTAKPPVCRIMDYGRYKYELKIKKKQCIIIWNKGIPRINTDNIYDVSIRRAIYIHFTIELEEHNVLESNTV